MNSSKNTANFFRYFSIAIILLIVYASHSFANEINILESKSQSTRHYEEQYNQAQKNKRWPQLILLVNKAYDAELALPKPNNIVLANFSLDLSTPYIAQRKLDQASNALEQAYQHFLNEFHDQPEKMISALKELGKRETKMLTGKQNNYYSLLRTLVETEYSKEPEKIVEHMLDFIAFKKTGYTIYSNHKEIVPACELAYRYARDLYEASDLRVIKSTLCYANALDEEGERPKAKSLMKELLAHVSAKTGEQINLQAQAQHAMARMHLLDDEPQLATPYLQAKALGMPEEETARYLFFRVNPVQFSSSSRIKYEVVLTFSVNKEGFVFDPKAVNYKGSKGAQQRIEQRAITELEGFRYVPKVEGGVLVVQEGVDFVMSYRK